MDCLLLYDEDSQVNLAKVQLMAFFHVDLIRPNLDICSRETSIALVNEKSTENPDY
jgi:hypothetical protein